MCSDFATWRYSYVQHAQKVLEHDDEPWQPPSHRGRHSAPHPALRHGIISQQAMEQRYILKLEYLIINSPIFCHDIDVARVNLRTKHEQNERKTYFSTMAADAVPRPPWCHPARAETYNNQPRPSDGHFRQGEGVLDSDGMPLLWSADAIVRCSVCRNFCSC